MKSGHGRRFLLGRLVTFPLACTALLTGWPAASQRSESDEPDDVRSCIDLMQIDHTRVADDDTILFYMRGGDIYRNELPNRCPTLDFEERFMYRVTLNRLCDLDVVTVLDDFGFGFVPGPTCGLGKFSPISEEEAKALIEQRRE